MKTGFVVSALLLLNAIAIAGCSTAKTAPATGTAPKGPEAEWTLAQTVKNPESTYYDAQMDVVFVSSVMGNPAEKDKNGWISTLTTKGDVIDEKWVSGLDAPKGMRSHDGTLWVSNIDEVIAIDIATAKIKKRVRIKGSKFLNDVAIGPEGEVYVSDTFGDAIWVVRNGKPSIFVRGSSYEAPNGLLVQGDKLIVAGWGMGVKPDFSSKTKGRIYSIDLKTKKKMLITPKPFANLDGLEVDANGNYLVSDWGAGKVFSVTPDGTVTVILEGFKGSADIGYITGRGIVVVPRMAEDQVSAYKLGG